MKELLLVFCLFGFTRTCFGLECYVCTNQADNRDKCIKTTIQCEERYDTCMTHMVWRAPAFWTPRTVKIHHLSKSCSSSKTCAMKQSLLGLRCMRDWYRDWECVECCQGDRCNFYVTLGSSTLQSNTLVLVVTAVLSLLCTFVQAR